MSRPKPEALVLALDVGSSSTRAALLDERGQQIVSTDARQKYDVRYDASGAAELDPAKLLRAVSNCVAQSLRARRETAAIRHVPIVATSASAFWHGLLALDLKRQPLTPIFMWADSRAVPDARELRTEFDERVVHARTGCMLRASFWPANLRWLRRTNGKLFARAARWVSPADWIFGQLFGTTATSPSMASATGLFNLEQQTWDEEMCDACGVQPETLEPIAVNFGAGKDGAQIFAAIGDGAASNLGCGADRAGYFAVNVGTSAAVRTIVESPRAIVFGLFRYLLDPEHYVAGGAVSNAGNLHHWSLRELRVDANARISRRERKAAATSTLDVLPFWVGERAPTWEEDLRGVISGLTQTTTASEIELAISCAVFYRLAQILELSESTTQRARSIIVSGGILSSPSSLPLLADSLGRDLTISAEREASLRGAAIYALERLGFTPKPLPRGRTVRHDRELARRHRERRARQIALEATLAA